MVFREMAQLGQDWVVDSWASESSAGEKLERMSRIDPSIPVGLEELAAAAAAQAEIRIDA